MTQNWTKTITIKNIYTKDVANGYVYLENYHKFKIIHAI